MSGNQPILMKAWLKPFTFGVITEAFLWMVFLIRARGGCAGEPPALTILNMHIPGFAIAEVISLGGHPIVRAVIVFILYAIFWAACWIGLARVWNSIRKPSRPI